jgi:hypothetical protein
MNYEFWVFFIQVWLKLGLILNEILKKVSKHHYISLSKLKSNVLWMTLTRRGTLKKCHALVTLRERDDHEKFTVIK